MTHRPARPARPALACAATVGLLTLAGCASPDRGGPAPSAAPDAETARAACAELPGRAGLPAATLVTRYVPSGTRRPGARTDGDFLPGHCVVTGSLDPRTGVDGRAYATRFELSLPDAWNGRFLYLGGGGNDGLLRDTTLPMNISSGSPSPLGQGYAVVSTDAGHSMTSAVFGADPEARRDHAYASHEKTARAARALIARRYGRPPDHAYFTGCSGGGRQGMMFAQRYPEYFDGIVAGAPAMRVSSGATVAALWNHQRLTEAAPRGSDGRPVLARALSDADLNLLATEINRRCDAADGLVDGMVQNTQACRFDPAALQCSGDKNERCLSAAQVSAVQAVFAGPRNRAGTALYAPQPWDPGLRDPGWRAWTLGTSTSATPNSRYVTLMLDALANEFFTPPDPGFDALAFNVDTDPLRMQWFSAEYDTYRDDRLSAFHAHGGKLMFVHGMADPIFSAEDTLDYYRRLAAHHGGLTAVQGFARTFLVPGMNHCLGGPATDTYDSLQAMVDWVERGIAPDRITARALPNNPYFPGRSRPLCPYPAFAKYQGQGDPEDAASFRCETP